MQAIKRADGRAHNELRPMRLTYDVFDYADGSVLLELGKTKVLCAVTLQQGVPPFLKGKKVGWLMAEYAMLPASTHVRTPREINSLKRNGRSIEISRLISRALRAVIQLDLLGEKTIIIDCDVLQADGSTRVACITGAYFALKSAVAQWLASGIIRTSILTDGLAAVSVGVTNGQVLLDIDYEEDSKIDADFNFVLTRSGNIVELQGSVEKNMISWDNFEQMKSCAVQGIAQIFAHDTEQGRIDEIVPAAQLNGRTSLFSLQNRLKSL
jgi:ribonuclease PH